MSWQRIVELARRQKMPVIITDAAGLEPRVLLPLEKYEHLSEGERLLPVYLTEPLNPLKGTSDRTPFRGQGASEVTFLRVDGILN